MPYGIQGVSSGTSGVLPSQTGNSGKFLTTDGTDPSWGTTGGAGKEILGEGAVFSGNQTITAGAAYADVTGASVSITNLNAAKTYNIFVSGSTHYHQNTSSGSATFAVYIDSAVRNEIYNQNGVAGDIATSIPIEGFLNDFTGATSISAKLQAKCTTANLTMGFLAAAVSNIKIMAIEV